jgi:hypothetical protein
MLNIKKISSFVAVLACSTSLQAEPAHHKVSSASYFKADMDIGCKSRYSSAKQKDLFLNNYKDHWFTWTGTVELADSGSASINIDGKGTQDLSVDFTDKNAGYDLIIGSKITVRFLMESEGGCWLPFSGYRAVIVK